MASKLITAGCSFSDLVVVNQITYKPIDVTPYGDLVAKHFGQEYVHEGACSGSNYRIWRTVMGHILSGNITPADTLIIQYTHTERDEFWSMHVEGVEVKYRWMDRPEYGGIIIRAKTNSHTGVNDKHNIEFLKMWEENHLNEDYQFERFKAYDAMFQAYLLHNEFKDVYFIKNNYNSPFLEPAPAYENNVIDATELSMTDGNWQPSDKVPGCHLSQLGHDLLAQKVIAHIENIRNNKL